MQPVRIEHRLQNKNAHEITDKLRKYAARREFEFDGDADRGSFGARGIEGTYSIERQEDDETVVIEITKKPFFLPGSFLASKTQERLSNWDCA